MKSSLWKTLSSWVLCSGYTGLIIWLAVQPPGRIPPWVARFDKLFHALQYAVLFLVALPAFYSSFVRRFCSAAFASFLYVALIGLLTEFLQSYTGARDASVGDLAADLVGAGTAMGFLWFYRQCLPEGVF